MLCIIFLRILHHVTLQNIKRVRTYLIAWLQTVGKCTNTAESSVNLNTFTQNNPQDKLFMSSSQIRPPKSSQSFRGSLVKEWLLKVSHHINKNSPHKSSISNSLQKQLKFNQSMFYSQPGYHYQFMCDEECSPGQGYNSKMYMSLSYLKSLSQTVQQQLKAFCPSCSHQPSSYSDLIKQRLLLTAKCCMWFHSHKQHCFFISHSVAQMKSFSSFICALRA